MVTAADILAIDDLAREPVPIPEWGGIVVYVGTMSAFERDRFEAGMLKNKDDPGADPMRNFRARLAVRCCYDESGKKLFSEDQAEALGQKSAKALDRIFGVAQRLNGLKDEDVEELAGNSEGTPTDDLPSA